LPPGELERLISEPQGALADVLRYHVLPGYLLTSHLSVLDGELTTTVGGNEIAVRAENASILLNDAQIAIADIEASNGVIHVVDTVLLPPADGVSAVLAYFGDDEVTETRSESKGSVHNGWRPRGPRTHIAYPWRPPLRPPATWRPWNRPGTVRLQCQRYPSAYRHRN
jgi:hypothetical protein